MNSDEQAKAAEHSALRRRAEERLQCQTPHANIERSAHDTERLIHELQVRQIELEIQNEELHDTRAQLEQTEAKLREGERHLADAQEIGRSGSWTWEPSTGKAWWSDAVFHLFGIEKSSVQPSREAFVLLLHPDDRPIVEARATAMLAGEIDEFANDLRVMRPDGTLIWMHSRAKATRGSSGDILSIEGTDQDITDRKLAEFALRESECRLSLALKSAKTVAFVWDAETDLVTRYFSSEPALPANLENPEPLAEIRARVHPDDLATFDAGVNSCLGGDTEYRNLYRTLRPDASVGWVEHWGYMQRNDDGTPRKLYGFSIDVTARMDAERSLRLTQFSIDRAVNSIFWISPKGEILFINDAVTKLLGYTREELIGRLIFQVNPNFTAAAWPAHWEEIKQRGSFAFESNQRAKDGRVVSVEVTVNYMMHEGQEYNCAFVRDLTDQKRTEGDLNRLWQYAIDPLCVAGVDGYFKKVNAAWTVCLGWTENELLSRPWLDFVHPDDVDMTVTASERMLKGESIAGFENRYRCINGSYRWFSWNIISELEMGVVYGFVRDVTESKRMESEFMQAQKMEAVGRLAGGVAHDFNNLLTIITGYGDYLLSELPSDSSQRESVDAILDASSRAARLTQQLLAFSRQTIVEPKFLDLNQVVEKSATMLCRLVEEDIEVTVVCDPNLPPIMASMGQVEQILMNLVLNSRDAMPNGGKLLMETRKVTLVLEDLSANSDLKVGDYAQLTVTDTGHGMGDQLKEKIFDPFFTTKEVGKGTGLGLSVVHGIVKQCGGEIAVDSTLSVGTTLKVLLPAAVDVVTVESKLARPSNRGAETILLAEDQEAVRKIVRMGLEKHGYKVLEACDGVQALLKASAYSGSIDLLLTDVVMPEMGGPELAEEMRKRQPGLHVLFMSGYTDDVVLKRGVSNSQEELLQKPFSAFTLAHKVRSMLDGPT